MDKNKWIEAKVKDFFKDYDPKEGLPWGYSDWDNYGTALESFLRKSFSDAWDKGRDEVNQAEGNI